MTEHTPEDSQTAKSERVGEGAAADAVAPAPYRVLARKYRPLTFAELIGQEAMVRVLTNAMARGRVAHAFILTGVRGVGKTTTARIIARALNCVGPDGTGDPTIEPCGVCEHCRAIIEDRHVDVIEMDAASRTGVDDIREVIDSVRYRPVTARFKVYIIDEVHMLSKNAFNALLKTLEEPPEHVKFVFATTEIRKVPVTVLSRCQRFDLRRVDQDTLAAHLRAVAEKEQAQIGDGALALIARAADGSVRDGLSLLDQAIVHGGEKPADAEAVRDMLGLADRALVIDLFEHVMRGAVAPALDLLGEMYRSGADPIVVMQDLLELVHWLSRLKIMEDPAESAAVSETERARGRDMAKALDMPTLTRAWQMLMKGLGEVQQAPDPLTAAEMVLIRLAYAADLPSPADLVKEIAAQGGPAPAPAAASSDTAAPAGGETAGNAALAPAPAAGPEEPPVPVAETQDDPTASVDTPDPRSFAEVAQLFDSRREALVAAQLREQVHLVRFEPGRIEFRPEPGAPADLASRLGKALGDWTGRRWLVSISGEPGEATLAEQARAAEAAHRAEAASHPLVKAALELFPDATITGVRRLHDADPAEPMDDDENEEQTST